MEAILAQRLYRPRGKEENIVSLFSASQAPNTIRSLLLPKGVLLKQNWFTRESITQINIMRAGKCS
jgi:hypothetical protein